MSGLSSGDSSPKVSAPPGLELQFTHNFPEECRDPVAAMILAVHWGIVHSTNLRLQSSTSTPTESLPSDWTAQILTKDDAASRFLPLEYKNPVTGRQLTVKIQSIADKLVAILVLEGNDDKKTKADTAQIADYVNEQAVKDGSRSVYEIFKVGKLREFCDVLKDNLFKEEEDTRGRGDDKTDKTPYGSKLSKEQQDRLDKEREERERERERLAAASDPDPLMIPPRGPAHAFPDPFRGIGRSDLDPFADITGGGMVLDPRGFRRPNLPQGIVPGARFDPIGPGGPLGGFGPRGGFGGGAVGPRRPNLPFGMPDHDHLPAHGYDDMFS